MAGRAGSGRWIFISRGVFNLKAMLTNRYSLQDWDKAFENLRAKVDVKAFVHPNGTKWS